MWVTRVILPGMYATGSVEKMLQLVIFYRNHPSKYLSLGKSRAFMYAIPTSTITTEMWRIAEIAMLWIRKLACAHNKIFQRTAVWWHRAHPSVCGSDHRIIFVLWTDYSATCLEQPPFMSRKIVLPDKRSFQTGSVCMESDGRRTFSYTSICIGKWPFQTGWFFIGSHSRQVSQYMVRWQWRNSMDSTQSVIMPWYTIYVRVHIYWISP